MNSFNHLLFAMLKALDFLRLHHHNSAALHLGYSLYNSSKDLSSHLKLCA